MYSKEIEENGEFNCLTINFKTETRINTVEDVDDFIAESQEEINSKDDYSFNGLFIVGSDLIGYIRMRNGNNRQEKKAI